MVVGKPDPEMSLLYFIRNQSVCSVATHTVAFIPSLVSAVGLTGSKLGCGEGGCGACTVMLSRKADGEVKHYAVNACLTPLCVVHGMAVTTVEGIGSAGTTLHPCQVGLEPLTLDVCNCSWYCTAGTNCKSSWISVWILYSWLCDVHVFSVA